MSDNGMDQSMMSQLLREAQQERDALRAKTTHLNGAWRRADTEANEALRHVASLQEALAAKPHQSDVDDAVARAAAAEAEVRDLRAAMARWVEAFATDEPEHYVIDDSTEDTHGVVTERAGCICGEWSWDSNDSDGVTREFKVHVIAALASVGRTESEGALNGNSRAGMSPNDGLTDIVERTEPEEAGV